MNNDRENIAARLWKAELEDAGVSDRAVSSRTPEAFAIEGDHTRGRWLKFSDAVLEAYALESRAKMEAAEAMARTFSELLAHYLVMANSGDCGFWDPEEEPVIIKSRARLTAWDAAQESGDA